MRSVVFSYHIRTNHLPETCWKVGPEIFTERWDKWLPTNYHFLDGFHKYYHWNSFLCINFCHCCLTPVVALKCVVAASGIRKVFVRTKCCCCCKKTERKVAVRNLSLRVNEGEVLGLLGPNGAGKTTAMNVITADIKADCGQVGGWNRQMKVDSRAFIPTFIY